MNIGKYLRGEDRHIGTVRSTKVGIEQLRAELAEATKRLAGVMQPYTPDAIHRHNHDQLCDLLVEMLAEMDKNESELAEATKDRDEWKQSTVDANARFKAAEQELAAIRQSQQAGEPVAWICECSDVDEDGVPYRDNDIDWDENKIANLPIGTKLYTAPQPSQSDRIAKLAFDSVYHGRKPSEDARDAALEEAAKYFETNEDMDYYAMKDVAAELRAMKGKK